MTETVKLTQFSPGAGCGCKISPQNLSTILKTDMAHVNFPNLLVGNSTKDDAAVYDIGNGQGIVSTTDFFTPIVDDPFDFGRIASVNAISDVYAMGGKPTMAIAILGWPIEKLSTDVAHKVIEGARSVCAEAGIPLAGGHSIEIGDPVFGLAVTGIVPTDRVKPNNTALAGSKLFLTKPIGIGIIATAEKRGIAPAEDIQRIVDLMTTLNKVGNQLADFSSVNSMTDVTGFGLLGHLLEICEGSQVNAEIEFSKVPTIENLQKYIDEKIFPGGLFRNFKSYGHKVHEITEQQKAVLCDPQTSGGLLVSVSPDGIDEVTDFMKSIDHPFYEIGTLTEMTDKEKLIKVI